MADTINLDPHIILHEQWPSLSQSERVAKFEELPRDVADDFFLELSALDQAELLRNLPEGQWRLWLRLLPPDDAADLIQIWPHEERDQLLRQLDDSSRREVT